MRLLAIIPARGGSKGVPGKNSKLLNGKPLISYTCEVAKQSKRFAKIIVSSDDANVVSIAESCGIEAPFIRPENLALDSTPTIDVVIHAVEFLAAKGEHFDAVCLLQPTNPFRSAAFLNKCIDAFSSRDYDSLVSVRKVPHEFNPHWTFEPDQNGLLKIATGESEIISRRQELPEAFHRDGSVYIVRTSVLLKHRSLYGTSIGYCESTGEPAINIDTPEDWKRAEAHLHTHC